MKRTSCTQPPRPCFILAALAVAALVPLCAGQAAEFSPEKKTSVWLVSPLLGAVRNEVDMHGPPGTPARTFTDSAAEYGLFAMYANPRLIVNDTLFNTDVNQTTVWGNITTLNVYGDPQAWATWHLGASYLWHDLDGRTADILVSEPIAKAGLMFRIPNWHLSLNPYLGYGWQSVETTVTTPAGSMEDTEHTGSVIYGLMASWRWRMLAAYAKYYLEDNPDRDEQYHVVRLWGTAMLWRHAGLLARFEYSEQVGSTDTSAMFGPVFYY